MAVQIKKPINFSYGAKYKIGYNQSAPSGNLKLNLTGNNINQASNIWVDTSGLANNATLINTTYNSANGGYLNFDGISSYCPVGNNILPTGSSYTIIAWFYRTTNSGFRNIFSSTNTPFFFSNDTLFAGVGGAYIEVSHNTSVINQWMCGAVTFDDASNTMTLYVDGVQVNTNNAVLHNYTQEDFYIGSHYAGGPVSFFEGRIGMIKCYNYAQNSAEINSIFNTTKGLYGL